MLGLRLALSLVRRIRNLAGGGPTGADTWEVVSGTFWETPGSTDYWMLPQ